MRRSAILLCCGGGLAIACHTSASSSSPPDAGSGDTWASRVQTFQLTVSANDVDTTFDVRDHFMAALEMQLSGEPFATTMGRNLTLYSRDHLPTNIYFDPTLPPPANTEGRVDLVGFSTAVESYEYSKQPLNNVGLESGAGLASMFGPVTNPSGLTGAAAQTNLRSLVQKFGALSNGAGRFIHPAEDSDSANELGWPGLWPTMMPFSSFDPHIQPTDSVSELCSISSDDDPGTTGSIQSDNYECDYRGLHLPNRSAQTSGTVDPGATGWHSWKAALWVLNYLQIMHDINETAVNTVADSDLSSVGTTGNTIVGDGGPGVLTLPGTFLGSSDIEGFQAAMYIEMINDQVEEWLTKLTTTDGSTLSGFSGLMDALNYSTSSPLRWFPGSVAVTETPDDAAGFPRPTGFTIASPDSQLLDLAGMLGAYSSLYALTDHANTQTGGSQPARVYFRGTPFADDDQIANGEPTTHDRMLAAMRVLVVNMERMHRDPTSLLLVDDVTMTGNAISRGTTLSADVAAYTLLALRTARRAVDSELTLYTNTTPDAEGAPCLMDSLPQINALPYSQELDSLIGSLAAAFYNDFTDATGTAYLGWNLSTGQPTDDGTNLDAHTAAIRGLLIAYLTTGNVQYRDRAIAVFQRLESAFYYAPARIYQATAYGSPASVTFTPRRFGLLQASLRDMYELVAVNAGHAAMAAEIEDRVARLNKLVLNGWDDRNQDEQISWPTECVRYITNYNGPGSDETIIQGGDGHSLAFGGLQMAERTLTGEIGSLVDTVPPDGGVALPRIITNDREQDCVPEVSSVGLPAALANSITFTLSPYGADAQ